MFVTDTAIAADNPTEPNQATPGGRNPAGDLAGKLAALAACSCDELREEWRRLYRNHPPKKIRRDLLELGVAWKLQEKALGGLGPVLKRRLAGMVEAMATKGDLARARAVTLRPGAKLVREWHGQVHEIMVVEEGFQWRGERWRSLTAIAHAITGAHWSGPRFFGLAASGKVGERDQDGAPDAVDVAVEISVGGEALADPGASEVGSRGRDAGVLTEAAHG